MNWKNETNNPAWTFGSYFKSSVFLFIILSTFSSTVHGTFFSLVSPSGAGDSQSCSFCPTGHTGAQTTFAVPCLRHVNLLAALDLCRCTVDSLISYPISLPIRSALKSPLIGWIYCQSTVTSATTLDKMVADIRSVYRRKPVKVYANPMPGTTHT